METPESIRTAIQWNDWTVSIDLSDAFWHIPIQMCKSAIQSLPFGPATSPWLFTHIMIEVKFMALQKVIIVHLYLDDWLIRSQSKEVLLNQIKWLLAICKTLGLRVHLDKSELTPTTDLIFLGYRYRTQVNRVFPTQKRIEQIQTETNIISQLPGSPSKTMAISYRPTYGNREASPTGKNPHERMREYQYCLKRQWKETNRIVGAPCTLRIRTFRFSLTHQRRVGEPHTLNWEVPGVWSPKERTLHINNLELRAVFLALNHWERVVIGKTILVARDNSNVVAFINKQGGTV